MQIDIEPLRHLPRELVDFARRQYVNATMYRGDERRREKRFPMVIPVRAVEVDQNWQALCRPFDLVTKDVASTSIGLIHTERVMAEFLAINMVLAGTDLSLVIRIRHCDPMGPFYSIGATYEERLVELPTGL